MVKGLEETLRRLMKEELGEVKKEVKELSLGKGRRRSRKKR